MALLRSLFQKRATLGLKSHGRLIELLGGGTGTQAGVFVSDQGALRQMAVWRAVNLTAGTVAGLPIEVFRDMPDGVRQKLDPPLFKGEAFPDLGWPEFVETQLLHLLLTGNAYALKILNEAGTAVVRLLPLQPESVDVERGRQTPLNPSGKLFRIEGMDEVLTPLEVLHVPGLSYDGLKGLSPIAHAREAVGASLAAERVAARMFDSGLLMGGILQAEVDLDDDQADEIKQRWRERTSGITQAHEIAIVSQGLSFQSTQMPPKDAQWLEARNYGVQEIARLYGVPADLLMENSATGNVNVEQRALFWVKFGLRHWVKRLESRYSAHLVPRGQKVKFNLDALLRGDTMTQANVFRTSIEAQYMTVNEVREIIGLAPVAWGDEPVPHQINQSESATVEPEDVAGEAGDQEESNDEA